MVRLCRPEIADAAGEDDGRRAALAAGGEPEIEGAEECVPVSFPGFFAALERVAER